MNELKKVFIYLESKDFYSRDERKIIRDELQKEIDDRMKKLLG